MIQLLNSFDFKTLKFVKVVLNNEYLLLEEALLNFFPDS